MKIDKYKKLLKYNWVVEHSSDGCSWFFCNTNYPKMFTKNGNDYTEKELKKAQFIIYSKTNFLESFLWDIENMDEDELEESLIFIKNMDTY